MRFNKLVSLIPIVQLHTADLIGDRQPSRRIHTISSLSLAARRPCWVLVKAAFSPPRLYSSNRPLVFAARPH